MKDYKCACGHLHSEHNNKGSKSNYDYEIKYNVCMGSFINEDGDREFCGCRKYNKNTTSTIQLNNNHTHITDTHTVVMTKKEYEEYIHWKKRTNGRLYI